VFSGCLGYNAAMKDMPAPALYLAVPGGEFAPAIRRAVALGFTQVAVAARADRPPEDLEALADSGLVVAAAALGADLPAGCSLDVPDIGARRRALDVVRRQVIDAARLGATCAWLGPGMDAAGAALACFAEACGLLADYAARRMIRLCVTHVPGSALPTAGQALAWIDQAPAVVGLLLDVGRLASGEEAGTIIRCAGPRLGGVIVDRPLAGASGLWEALRGVAFRGVLLVRREEGP
jgi:sugar phosphate isomerase/epimerase